MMKQIFSTVIFFILIINTHAQNKSIISEIEKTVLAINNDKSLTTYKVPSNEISKVEKYGQDENIDVFKKGNQTVKIVDYSKDNGGGYEQTTLYFQNEKPIFIEKEQKGIIKARYFDKVEVSEYIQKSKIFIINWDNNIIEFYYWDKNTNEYKEPTKEHKKIMFASEKFEIYRILKLSKSATKNIIEK